VLLPPQASTRYGFAGSWGYQHDALTSGTSAPAGIGHIGARYYEPVTGRFLQREPLGLVGSINAYTYAFNVPTVLVDPDGRAALAVSFLGAEAARAALAATVVTGTIAAMVVSTQQASSTSVLPVTDILRFEGNMTIGQIMAKYVRGNVSRVPLPPGGPDWRDILKMTWDELVCAAKKGQQWARTLKKVLERSEYHK
jgi:RHS repeat-associated protein